MNLKKYLHEQICMEIFLRDFRNTFNPQTERPWGGVWSATNFYEKHHILIAVLTDAHLGEITEMNISELYRLSVKCVEIINVKKKIYS
jgi:hypothetical protein